MSDKAERLQDAIGLIKDEYIIEAHAEDAAASAVTDEVAGVDVAGAKPTDGVEASEVLGKVIQMPAQKRKRRIAAPIAVAACLVLALGVGVAAYSGMTSSPYEKLTEPAETKTVDDSDAALSGTMEERATEAPDGEPMAMGTAETGTDAYVSDGYGSTAPDMPPSQRQGRNPDLGEAFVLTGAEWNDNSNWSFFMNLVNSGLVSFPSYGIDPTHRVKVTVVDANGNPVRNQEVELRDGTGRAMWTAVSDKQGNAYLFYPSGKEPYTVAAGNVEEYLPVTIEEYANGQGNASIPVIEDVTLVVNAQSAPATDLQVMFIVDTTGSMSDEIAYLQKDFASIAGEVGSNGVEYSVNFYRDRGDVYVTKCNGFTSDVSFVQALLNDERADGGGDTPEAVAQILSETITGNQEWRADSNKVAFLIFDAPPHDGYDDVIDAAVRSAAKRGIKVVPVVASNADRETELFGRALAICTGGTYVFLTDDSGVGNSHLEPIVGDYTVESLHNVIVRIINENR